VAADEQVVARAGGGEPGPGIPALALGAAARGADLQRRLCFSSAVTACAQVIFVPAARVRVKSGGTRSTYAWPSASKNSRSCVQLP